MYEDWLRKNNIEERLFTAAELRVLNENLLCEMAVIWPRDSGIPYKLWLDPAGIARGNEHTFSPRVKMEAGGKFIPVEVSDSPQIPSSAKKMGAEEPVDFSAVQKYIRAYKDIILAHFNGKVSDKEVMSLLGSEQNADTAEKKLNQLLQRNGRIIEYYYDAAELIFVVIMYRKDDPYRTPEYRDIAVHRGELLDLIQDLKNEFPIVEIIDASVSYEPDKMHIREIENEGY